MNDKDIIELIKNNKIVIGILTFSAILILIILLGDSSENKRTEVKSDMSQNKTVRDENDIENVGGDYTGGDKTTNNYFGVEAEERTEAVYNEINITGKIMDKNKEGIPDIIVELVSPQVFSEPSDDNGNFSIYINQATYKQMGQIRVAEEKYKKYSKEIAYNAKNFPIRLELK